ncbi:hypothetical protein CHS0354_033159 [Potamilus streckersoni]|uniref:Sulfotransferase domain-containing protein n=1 Tax=Potamilus streckersoni TaxID=2493646 RepID=A0AAE0VPQ7_9BIVA|nr:hypothetical protein CHS0354_033159 [Potamilus streckersoni]
MKLSWRGIYIVLLCSLVLFGLYFMIDTGNKSQTDTEKSRRLFETLVQDKLDPSHKVNQKNVLLKLYKQQVEMQHADIHHAHVQNNLLPVIHELQAVSSDTHMPHNLSDTPVRHYVMPYTHMHQIDSMLLEDKITVDVLSNKPDIPTSTNNIGKPNNYYQQEYLKLANEYIANDPRVPVEDKNNTHEDLQKKIASVLNYTVKEIYSMVEYISSMNERIDLADLTPRPDFDLVECGRSTVTSEIEDLLCMETPITLRQFKNPCWYNSNHTLRCMPYFQVIGVDKCGSTDLFDKISTHPDILPNEGILKKETMWWSWRRYGHWLRRSTQVQTFEDYLNYFTGAATAIERTVDSSGLHYLVTGDGTPMDFWDFSGWTDISQNYGLLEPNFLTPHLIRHVNPDVKMILIFRDPMERLYSDYYFLGLGKMTPVGFHEEVKWSIYVLHECIKKNSLRKCLFSREFHVSVNARIHVGFYSVFLKEWLKVFSRHQFLFLKTEEYSQDPVTVLQHVFSFLNLRGLSKEQVIEMANRTRVYETKRKKNAAPMLNETRAVLERLYNSFNEDLVEILHDNRFLWKDATSL